MVHPMRAALFALLSLSSLAAAAQDAPAALCRAYDNGQWQTLGRGSLESCLKAVDQSVLGYNSQGFKFGLAGRQLLAADNNYFYRSEDQGRSWSAFGYRGSVKAILDAAAPLQPVTLPVATADVLQPSSPIPQVEERSCSVYGEGAWKTVGNLPLPACGDALDRAPNQYDDTGYKYGYWGKLYLAADAKNILTSDNGENWTPLRPR
ncbi:hypothetical protein [Solimonas sp. SE-A11]|uniref:hypothetical protein n=1 Tax=Solimonas sp. SE-A11 TaxID=3054954 RepID=UPI00259CFD20|nr:hypothetical protein [Solimonas sp. SE-A11]MDM4769985.1 hypothetical protein [Solimonas sp. SE-A11]